MGDSLQRSWDLVGNDATLLYDAHIPSSMREICKSNGKDKGGAWECYNARQFFGWESNNVVAVTNGAAYTIEMATRAKTQLILILIEDSRTKGFYSNYQKYLQAAADKGLAELCVGVNVNGYKS